MLGHTEQKNIVFKLGLSVVNDPIKPGIDIETRIVPVNRVSSQQWRDLKCLQGWVNIWYLKLRYGSAKTFLLLAYVDTELVHVEWVVPSEKISSRYPFVADDSYSIISCLTEERFRGLGIFSSQIQKVVEQDVPAKVFWIWSEPSNRPSLRAIRKAGGVKAGEFVQKKWLWGFVSCGEYFPYFPEGSGGL